MRHFLGGMHAGIMGKRRAPWEKVTGTDLKAPLRHEWRRRLGDCGGKLVCYLGRVYTSLDDGGLAV